jgi:hypothetical protein
MKLSKTTVAGSTAAALIAAANVPGNPHWLIMSLNVGAAAAIAVLGKHSAECPDNCPGTGPDRRPWPWQRPLLTPLLVAVAIASLCGLFSGCVAPNPKAGPGAPGEPAYIVSPALTTASNSIVPLATTAGQVTNTGPLLPTAANAAFLLIASLSGLWAAHKSKVASTLADGVVAAGPAAVSAVCNATRSRTKAYAVRQEMVASSKKVMPPEPEAPK